MANEKTFEVFCSECGEKFTASSKMAHLCPACKAKRQEEKKAYAKEYAKKRTEKLGLVTIQIFKDDREKLKALAAKNNCIVWDIVASMLKTEEKEDKKEEKQPAKKATKKAE